MSHLFFLFLRFHQALSFPIFPVEDLIRQLQANFSQRLSDPSENIFTLMQELKLASNRFDECRIQMRYEETLPSSCFKVVLLAQSKGFTVDKALTLLTARCLKVVESSPGKLPPLSFGLPEKCQQKLSEKESVDQYIGRRKGF